MSDGGTGFGYLLLLLYMLVAYNYIFKKYMYIIFEDVMVELDGH